MNDFPNFAYLSKLLHQELEDSEKLVEMLYQLLTPENKEIFHKAREQLMNK